MLKRMVVIAALGAMVLPTALPVAPVSASPKIFENLTGKWRGKGLVKGSAKAKKESIRCRMSNKKSPKPGRIDLTGSCAVSGFVFSLNGYIVQNGNQNSYTASMFRSLTNLKQSDFSGKRSGTRINFRFSARDRVTRTDVVATIKLNAKSANAFDVQISRTDPDTGKVFDVGSIAFAKR